MRSQAPQSVTTAEGRRGAAPDVLVVGGGPAGLAAATAASDAGASVLIAEREARLGGILGQCIHDGFGLELFGESLTGPELAIHLEELAARAGVESSTRTTVTGVDPERCCRLLGPEGYGLVQPGAVVLAMGCRERSFGSLAIPSARPAGILGAGAAQRLLDIDGLMPGRRVVILGSGDVGLIMARRMTLEGAEVSCVVERLPYPGGLARNVSQCLNDFSIPLLLRHTVVGVSGRGRVSGVTLATVDDQGAPVSGSEREVECDTLLVSVGLIPENELARSAGIEIDPATGGAAVDESLMTSVRGVFSAGNVLHVHDVADRAVLEGGEAGRRAAAFAAGGGAQAPPPAAALLPAADQSWTSVRPGVGVRYVVPQRLRAGRDAVLHFRVNEPLRRTVVRAVIGAEVVASREFPYLAPSEMARLEVAAMPAAGLPATGILEVRLD